MATSTLGSGTLVLAGTTSGTTTVTATAVAGTTTLTLPAATDTLVGRATTDTLTNKTLTGAAMNGTLGATTASTVAATTLTTSSTVTHNGGTANGVPYLDGSKVLTTGSALTFDGSSLALGMSALAARVMTVRGRAAFVAPSTDSQLAIYSDGTTNGIYSTYNASGSYLPMTFYTSDVERARIDTSGNLLVGQTSANSFNLTSGFGFDVRNSFGLGVAVQSNPCAIFNRNTSTGTIVDLRYNGTTVGSISYNGTVTAYNSTSDYRLKNITGPVTNAKDFIMSLQPKQGTWKADGSKFVGFLAHEFQEVSPSSVTGEKDAVDADGKPIMQSMQASSAEVMANLISLVQEQQALITTLTARITALEGA